MRQNFGTSVSLDDDVSLEPTETTQEPLPEKEAVSLDPVRETSLDETPDVPLADETTTIHCITADDLPESPDALDEEPPRIVRARFPRRTFLIGAGLIVAATAAGVAYRLLVHDDVPDNTGDRPSKVDLENSAGAVPEATDDGVYTVGDEIEPGLYIIGVNDAADAGWLSYKWAEADGDRSWPAVKQAVSVTVSAQETGDVLTLKGSAFKSPAPVTDLADAPTHAGLFLVGTDIEAGTYTLTGISADDFCDTEFGETAPTDELHPTLWHKTCARAASATRAVGRDIEPWRGYVLCEPTTSGDICSTLDDTSPAALSLLTAEDPTVTLKGTIEDGNTVDNYLSWLVSHGLTAIKEGDSVDVELKDGMCFAPVMCTVERKA